MTEPGGPGRRGRHSAGDGTGGIPFTPRATGGFPPVPGRPQSPPARWSHDDADHPRARRSGGNDDAGPPSRPDDGRRRDTQHPSAPLPPLPSGVWDRLQPRTNGPADDATVAAHRIDPSMGRREAGGSHDGDLHDGDSGDEDDDPGAPHSDPADGDTDSWDRTGGLEVIGAHVEDDALRRGSGRGGGGDGGDHGADHDGGDHDDRGGAGAVGPGRSRRRRPLAVLLSLLVLGGLVVGIVLGVQALLGLTSGEDYAGEGAGSVEIRVREGDTLSDIARTLVEADAIASTSPFVDAAEGRPEATGIQPGVYGLRSKMSGQAALDLLLSDGARLFSRVTIPEGFTVERTLERIAEETGLSIEELQTAAADTVALGLPAYANGQLEGYLFPATYDVEPDDSATDVLRRMVRQFTSVATALQLEQRAAAAGRSPAQVVTVASMIQSETRLDDERPDVGQVIYNRLDQGIPLGIDAALAFGLSKSGADLTVTDLQTDGPYNLRTRTGLPPTAISSTGEASLEAALVPSTGDLLYYVLESADGAHFFTSDYAKFQTARQRCAQAGLGCGG